MAIGMKNKTICSFEKKMKKKEMIDNLSDVIFFFKRVFMLSEYAIFKALSVLTIPFLIVGGIGAYNCFKMIVDAIENSIFFMDSIYFQPAWQFLGVYMIYQFVKMGIDCNLAK